MKACISKSVLGADKNLLIDADTFSWSSSIPDDYWVLGDEKNIQSLDVISRAVKQHVELSPGENWLKMWGQITDGSTNPMWSKMLPGEVYREYVSRIVDDTRILLNSINDTYFVKEFLIGRELILGLCKAKINEIRFYSLLGEVSESRTGSISSFKPDASGLSEPPLYDQTGSATGRLTISKGPNILTLNKEYRDILISRYNGGQILNIDFVSLEPRILYGINKGEPPDDIYETISNELFCGEIDRKVIKAATIGSIYGLSSRKFATTIGEDDAMKASEILRGVKLFFDLSKLSSRLLLENKNTGAIFNFFGRPLFPGEKSMANILVSHYIQSTGVDVSLVGFNILIKKLKDAGAEFCPIFLIHDAILIDSHPDHISKIKKIAKEGIRIPGMDFNFPLDVTKA